MFSNQLKLEKFCNIMHLSHQVINRPNNLNVLSQQLPFLRYFRKICNCYCRTTNIARCLFITRKSELGKSISDTFGENVSGSERCHKGQGRPLPHACLEMKRIICSDISKHSKHPGRNNLHVISQKLLTLIQIPFVTCCEVK